MNKLEIYELPVDAPPRSFHERPRIPKAAVGVTGLWLIVVCTLFWQMEQYTNNPGEMESAPRVWPAGSTVPLGRELPTLLMFIHPKCPCTQSSLRELEVLLAQSNERVNAHLLFIQPEGVSSGWVERSGTWSRASTIRGVSVHLDKGGELARIFGSRTSGHTVLYDTDGKLLFEGGITASRGHSGDNIGRGAVTQLLRGARTDYVQTPVFGCGLFDADCAEGGAECAK